MLKRYGKWIVAAIGCLASLATIYGGFFSSSTNPPAQQQPQRIEASGVNSPVISNSGSGTVNFEIHSQEKGK